MAMYGHAAPSMGNYTGYPEYHNRDSIPRMPTQNNVPQSPTSSAGNEDEEFIRSTTKQPNTACHEFDGRIYGLKVVQQPNRARMCGFGDKDRRPISAPPILQLIILDSVTRQEIDYTDSTLEMSHFVCSVDIYNRDGSSPKNLLRSSPSGSSISMTTTSEYPVTQVARPPEVHAQRLPITDSAYRMVRGVLTTSYGQQPAPGDYANYHSSPYMPQHQGYAGSSSNNGAFPQSYGPPRHHEGFHSAPNPYEDNLQNRASLPNTQNGYQQPGRMAPNPYAGPPHGAQSIYPPQNGTLPGPYTDAHTMQPNYPPGRAPPTPPADGPTGQPVKVDRNLIGTLCTSAVLLNGLDDVPGIYFIWSDLSVRTEDWFSLKFSFFNVGGVLRDASWEEVAARARVLSTYPSDPPKEGTPRHDKSLSGVRAPLLAKTAPCLSTVFSQCFKVFSAKKFPGVVESTPLNAHFAKQGVKITVRNEKDPNDKDGRSKRKRDADDDDDDDD